jgi:predicted nucleotidyltransferase
MKNKGILTKKELATIDKKLSNQRLTQQDSNRLSRFIRPKLRAMSKIDSEYLLTRLQFNPASIKIEEKIKKFVLKNVTGVKAIIVVGSAIQTGYKEYRDIDLIIVTNKKDWGNQWDKERRIGNLLHLAKNEGLELDIQITSKDIFRELYGVNPSWIYQLKDHKIIYGNIKIPSKINLSKMDLRMKLDWSDLDGLNPTPMEIYNALRNVLLVRLLMNKIVDNESLKKEVVNQIGFDLLNKLKEGNISNLEKRYLLSLITNLAEKTRKEIIESKWEKIELSEL